ncbi:MAG: GPP34 family phosphoprotein [Nocardioides sp.]|uniref:GOLPH3/VPS74 family protein n=1 Tax=Nocardioides sp. TaxID=35761 RepID=UPI003F09D9F0
MDYLIAEDVFLLLTCDEDGRTEASTYLDVLMGGALLVELAERGLVEIEDKRGFWHSPKVTGQDGPGPEDPVLAEALTTVLAKQRTPEALVERLGRGTRTVVADRLVERGVLRREQRKVLGLFPYTRHPAADSSHEDAVRERLVGVLVHGLEPDPHTGAVIALLHSIGWAHKVVATEGSTAQVKARAKEIARGQWAAAAVKAAIDAYVAAMIATTTATTVVVSS